TACGCAAQIADRRARCDRIGMSFSRVLVRAWPAIAAVLIGCSDDSDPAMMLTQVVPGTCRAVTPFGQIFDPGMPGQQGAANIPVGYISRLPLDARTFMVVATHPVAAKVGCDILDAGGSAVDAAVAVQMVLNLAEPQASGIGGGGFLVYYDAA